MDSRSGCGCITPSEARGVWWWRWLPRAAVLSVLLLAAEPAAGAIRPRVAVIKSSSIAAFEQATTALVKRLQRDPLQPEVLTFDLDGDLANGPIVLLRVHQANPGLIITVGSLATTAALDDVSTVPVVFSMVLYPRQSGFLSYPSRRVTGASLDVPLDTQFQQLRRVVPAARRVGVLFHPKETGSVVEAAREVASRHGLSLVAESVDDPMRALDALGVLMEQVDVIWTVADSHVFTPRTTPALILAALRRRVPLFGLSTAHVRVGAVAALYSDYTDVGAQTAAIALRVLRGEDAGSIPVSSPRSTRLALNARTAEHVGLAIASDLEAEAGEVIR